MKRLISGACRLLGKWGRMGKSRAEGHMVFVVHHPRNKNGLVVALQRENMRLKDHLERINDRYSAVAREQTTARESSAFLRDKVAAQAREIGDLTARAKKAEDKAKYETRKAKTASLVRTPSPEAELASVRGDCQKLGDYACRGYDRGDTSSEARLVRQIERDVRAKAASALL